jgi:hypothetical protein
MKPFLIGTEAEYSLSGRNARGPVPPDVLCNLLHEAVRRERTCLPDANGGRSLYLENGARLYVDSGEHPEHASPECFTPRQAACYDKAGEMMLRQARDRLLLEQPTLRLSIVKNNLDPVYPDQTTWGCHESYTSWMRLDQAAPQLIPHIVSRVIYAGAGCLSAHPEGNGFELSQRARHLVVPIGDDTMSCRALFCTRVRKRNDYAREGWVRAHLIAKDSQRSPFGIYLTLGTTALLFVLLNEGRKVGAGLMPAEPLRAVRAFSCDPWLKVRVPLADGRQLSALEIQESYLAECEQAVQAGGLPEWAGEVLRHWRQTLEALGRDPLLMARRLDPYRKLLVYGHELERAGFGWADLRQALQTLTILRRRYSPAVLQVLLGENEGIATAAPAEQVQQAAAEPGVSAPGRRERLRFAVRLQALELRYHELGGLYDRLAEAGQVEDVILGAGDVERASREPPPGGRAALRAAAIKSPRSSGWLCDWRFVFHPETRTYLDLRNPFATECNPVSLDSVPREDWPRWATAAGT